MPRSFWLLGMTRFCRSPAKLARQIQAAVQWLPTFEGDAAGKTTGKSRKWPHQFYRQNIVRESLVFYGGTIYNKAEHFRDSKGLYP